MPRILLSKELKLGQSLVAISHASLAWYLKFHQPQDALQWPIGYQPEDILRVDPAELDSVFADGTSIAMTESRLDGKRTAVVGEEGLKLDPAHYDLAPESILDDVRMLNVKMYILIRRALGFEQAKCAAANAPIQAFARFSHDNVMRNWLAGRFYKTLCSVTESEFERALSEEKHAVVSRTDSEEPAAAAFCPRTKWPGRFKFLQLYR